jgi:hypothetical protein
MVDPGGCKSPNGSADEGDGLCARLQHVRLYLARLPYHLALVLHLQLRLVSG